MIITIKINTSKLIKDVRFEEINGKEFDAYELFNETSNLSITFKCVEHPNLTSSTTCSFIQYYRLHLICPKNVLPFVTVFVILSHLINHVPDVGVIHHLDLVW